MARQLLDRRTSASQGIDNVARGQVANHDVLPTFSGVVRALLSGRQRPMPVLTIIDPYDVTCAFHEILLGLERSGASAPSSVVHVAVWFWCVYRQCRHGCAWPSDESAISLTMVRPMHRTYQYQIVSS